MPRPAGHTPTPASGTLSATPASSSRRCRTGDAELLRIAQQHGTPPAVTEPVPTPVPRNRVEPGAEPASIAELPNPGERVYEAALCHVLRLVRISRYGERDAIHGLVVPCHQFGEGIGVPVLNAPNKSMSGVRHTVAPLLPAILGVQRRSQVRVCYKNFGARPPRSAAMDCPDTCLSRAEPGFPRCVDARRRGRRPAWPRTRARRGTPRSREVSPTAAENSQAQLTTAIGLPRVPGKCFRHSARDSPWGWEAVSGPGPGSQEVVGPTLAADHVW